MKDTKIVKNKDRERGGERKKRSRRHGGREAREEALRFSLIQHGNRGTSFLARAEAVRLH